MKKAKSLLDPMTFAELASLPYDNAAAGDYWVIRCGDDIYIHQQQTVVASAASVRVPIAHMRRLVAKLTKKQTPRTRKREDRA